MKRFLTFTTPDGLVYETPTDWMAVRYAQQEVLTKINLADLNQEQIMQAVQETLSDDNLLIAWAKRNIPAVDIFNASRIVSVAKFNQQAFWENSTAKLDDAPCMEANEVLKQTGITTRTPLGIILNALLPPGEITGGITIKVPSGDHYLGLVGYRGPKAVCDTIWASVDAAASEAVNIFKKSSSTPPPTTH